MSTATTPIHVRTAAAADVPALSSTLAEAFRHDPVLTWCYPDHDRRAQLLPFVFRVVLEHTVPHGGVETVDPAVSGAVWVPPTAAIDEDAMAGELLEASGDYAERVVTALELIAEHHPTEEHEYLFILGTRDAWRSRGLGSALIRSVTTRCDRDGVGAYLEATSERNRSLYERHGFSTTEVLHLPDGPPLWCMWRHPKPA